MARKRFHVLACDYDGTLATHGRVDADTVAALQSLRESGRRLVMVTGRRLEELLSIFPEAMLFDRIVAENGALCYDPEKKEEELLAEPPTPDFVKALVARGVGPIEIGRAIVATWEPHEKTVLEVIRDLGLGLQIILNKGAVMILASQVTKATGLAHALRKLGYSSHNAVGVGDAENDHALLAYCECGAAVSNAVPALRERADLVLKRDHGAGVVDLIGSMVTDDLASVSSALHRHDVQLGKAADGAEVSIPGFGANVILRAREEAPREKLVQTLSHQLSKQGYQWCLISDAPPPRTDDDAILLGTETRAPTIEEFRHSLERPRQRVVLHCARVHAMEQGPFIQAVIHELSTLRESHGRPHWIIWYDSNGLLKSATEHLASLADGMVFATSGDGTSQIPQLAAPVVQFVDTATDDASPSAWRFGLRENEIWFDRAVALTPTSTNT